MRWVRAKVGTLAVRQILHLKGRLKLGEFIEWRERGENKWTRAHRGLIDKINSDGLIFVERM